MPEVDQAYLLSAYKRYKSLFISSDERQLKVDSFQEWLLKRGIRKRAISQSHLVTH